jgi:hypothetical protein
MEFDLRWLQQTIARHLPDFYLHHDDQYLPCSAEFFMQHCELQGVPHNSDDNRDNGNNPLVTFATRGSLTGAILVQFQDEYPEHRLWMQLDPEARRGQPLNQLQDVPVYAHCKAIISKTSPNHIEALEVTYITLFAYNGDYEVIPVLMRGVGAHDGDIEHITARVNPKTGDLIAMWYNAHRCRDGQWVPAADVPKSNTSNRHAAYIAKHGHGNYPSVGTVHRHFFLGNDKCSDTGPVWRPKTVVLLPPHHDVLPEEESNLHLRRKLYCTRSRGCSLSSEVEEIEVEIQAATMRQTAGGGGDSGDELVVNNNDNCLDSFPRVITTDSCEWIHFRGLWGETEPPINQQWYHQAETPVSRSPLQRLFLHLWPETESI